MNKDTKLLEVTFINDGAPEWYSFLKDAMFADVDCICEQYDFTDDVPESDLQFTTRGKIMNSYTREMTLGAKYIVTVDRTDNISIYKIVNPDL